MVAVAVVAVVVAVVMVAAAACCYGWQSPMLRRWKDAYRSSHRCGGCSHSLCRCIRSSSSLDCRKSMRQDCAVDAVAAVVLGVQIAS